MRRAPGTVAAAAIAAVSACGCGSEANPACADPLLIDDMEDGDRFICASAGRQGTWYTVDDGTSTNFSPRGEFTQSLIPGGRSASHHAAHLTGFGFTDWGAAIGLFLNGEGDALQTYDASAAGGIRFWMKSNAAVWTNFLVPETAAVGEPGGTCVDDADTWNCDNHFQFWIPAPPPGEWAEYDIPFTAARQPFFRAATDGNPITGSLDLDPAHLLGVQFNVDQLQTFDTWVDDVRFYSCASACAPSCTDANAPVACPASHGVPADCWPAETDCSALRALTLNSVSGSSSSDAWAVGGTDPGQSGIILHWDGSAWSAVPGGTISALNAVWSNSPSDAWAVGNNGTIIHWNGADWSPRGDSPTNGPFQAVWGSGPDDVWAVGGGGTITHWTGSSWIAVPSGTTSTLNGVWGTGPADVWAVGYSGRPGFVGGHGIILHWDGSNWSSVPETTGLALASVWGSAPNDVWAVGRSATILHWNGATWTEVPSQTTARIIYSVWGSAAQDIWALTSEALIVNMPNAPSAALHWGGSVWSVSPTGHGTLRGLWGSGSNDVWAVGKVGTILHWDGTGWSLVPVEVQ